MINITDFTKGLCELSIQNLELKEGSKTNKHKIRTLHADGHLLFLAKDATKLLGYNSTASSTWLIRHLDRDQIVTVPQNKVDRCDIKFPNRGATCITESGLYKLIMRSNKPLAKPFQDWVCRDVLPSIRKTGGYVFGEEDLDLSSEAGLLKSIATVSMALQSKLARVEPVAINQPKSQLSN